MERDRDYYRRRFAEELVAAERSSSIEAEQCHRQLAFLYARMLSALEVRAARLAASRALRSMRPRRAA